jgi:hypothetical protein
MADRRPSDSPPSDAVLAAVRAEARRWRRRFLLTALLAVLIVAALVSHGVFGPVPSPEVPEELRGAWVSDDPRYAGRELEFGSNLVILGTGDSAARETYPVYDVRRQASAGVTRYLITYLIGREDVTLSVSYRSGPPRIELVNPGGVVWRRRPPS